MAAEAAAEAAEEAASPAVAAAVEPPDDFLCPVSHELMADPVLATDGHTYERREIERWFRKKLTSPKTGEALGSAAVFPNHSMRRMIVEWREAHGV